MRVSTFPAALALAVSIFIPANAFAGARHVGGAGGSAISASAAATILNAYATNVFDAPVAISGASGGAAARAGCTALANLSTFAVAGACRIAGAALVAGSAADASGNGYEVVAGDAVASAAGASSSTAQIGGAAAHGNSLGLLSLAGGEGYPASAAAALDLATGAFPKLSAFTYTAKSAPRGSYAFVARATFSGSVGQGAGAILLTVSKSATGQTVVSGVVGTGRYAAIATQ